MFRGRRSEIKQIARTLKIDAEIAGTFQKFGLGTEDETVGYELIKYSPYPSTPTQRGLLSVVRRNGVKVPVFSAHEDGEPINAGDYDHQRDLGIRYARQEGVSYGELDIDAVNRVLRERGK